MTIHPGQGCGPHHLCSKFAPLFTWDPGCSGKVCAIEESVTDDSCIFCACEKYLKRKINLENYVPHWAYMGSIENTPSVYSQTVKQSPLSIQDSSMQNIYVIHFMYQLTLKGS